MTVPDHRAGATDLRVPTFGRDHAVRLAVRGELDMATAGQFASAGQGAVSRRSRTTLAIDMGRVTFIDAAGVGALVTIRNHARRHDNAVVVIAPSRCVARLLELTGLTGLIRTDRHLRLAQP